jgi:predicted Fe-Mo cluster-binding NifX family protein
MRICFPVHKDLGTSSTIADNFSSAPLFVIVDTELNHSSTIVNRDPDRADGGCNPFKALVGRALDGIVVDNVGDEMVLVMSMAGHHLFQAVSASVSENLALFVQGHLPEIQVMNRYVEGRYYTPDAEAADNPASRFAPDKEWRR